MRSSLHLSPHPGRGGASGLCVLNNVRRFSVAAPEHRTRAMNILKGILLKLVSALMFAVMQALVRSLGEAIPVGQVVFFRSAFAVVLFLVIYALRSDLASALHLHSPVHDAG